MGFRIFFILFISCFSFSQLTTAEVPLKAAFIRDNQLWMVEGEKEQQLTTGRHVYSPKWSQDGRFIAYLDGDKNGETTYLYVYDTKQKRSYQPYETIKTRNFQWSPVSNQIAYNAGGVLNVTKIVNGRPKGFVNVSLGVSDFVWFPNGKEFIVSAQSNLLPTGWEPVHLFKVPINANLNEKKIKPFYTIKTNTNDLFAINASYFKWSADHNWVSFLAIPTASWSNDSNTLCVLSSKGNQFQSVGKMLWYEDWMKWAPRENKLAYISGEGRFLVQDKKTKVADIPILNQQKEYTPKGYVDLDLDWLAQEEVIVARAKEKKEWEEGPVPTMYTSLFVINILSGEQKQITFPKSGELDSNPQVVGSYITWYRKGNQGDIWIKKGIDGHDDLWLKDVDITPVFYTSKK
ncbi:translocation protein TolB [Cytobacillus sp. S13-E01]|uniref:translocation protein TolB n=1 Tax=Cytobacillus sp. S13-E01 TaxID=3031326 RepID=UPI0023D8519B|nr:translocation protein TolB [Cytobacillus sp. S13-E01]MDF0728857.1 translocation protein TolB [Cytobacillus sp. S13-E01]